MRRGTTPTVTFHLPFNVNVIRAVEIYFAQNGTLLVEKDTSDCVLVGTTVSTTLTQTDTLKFDSDDTSKIEIQIRFVFIDGSVDATTIYKVKATKILKDGEVDVDESEGGGSISPDQIYATIDEWMEDHPDGGVQNGAITEPKLSADLKAMVRQSSTFANVAFLHEDDENCRYPEDGFGLCCVMWDDDTVIVNDFGSSADGSTLPTFLASKGIRKVDAVIISHYHNDHIIESSLNGFLNSNIDYSDCTFYLPHGNIDWTSFVGTSGDVPHENQTMTKTKLAAKNIPYIEPDTEGYHVDIGNFSIDFYNVNSEYFDDYYQYLYYSKSATKANETCYNCFSMCANIAIGGSNIWLGGDIELPAQENMAPHVGKADVFLVPHHGRNMRESLSLINNLSCKVGVICPFYDVDGGSTSGILSPTAMRCRQLGTLVSTFNKHVMLVVSGGRVYAEENDSQNGLGIGHIVQQYTDFNDLGHGDWFCHGTASDILTYSHSPTAVVGFNCSFTMHVEPLNLGATGTDNIVQTAYLRGDTAGAPCILQRIKNVTWSEWTPVSLPLAQHSDDGSFDSLYGTVNPTSIRGYLQNAEVDNLNSATLSGMYITKASASNLPSGVTSMGFLLVMACMDSGTYKATQLWIPSTADSIRFRRCSGSTWTAWKALTPA